MRTLSMTRDQFRAEGVKIESEFKAEVKKIITTKGGGKKVYFRDSDGVIRTRRKNIWKLPKPAKQKEANRIYPALPQYADVEDTCRTSEDKKLQIEHLQYRYHKCLDIHTGEPLTGEARQEWFKGREARQDWIPEKAKSHSRSVESDTINKLTEIFAFVSKLDSEGIERYQQLVTQYKDGDEAHYE